MPNIKEEIIIKCYSCERCGAKKGAQHNLRAALVSTAAGFTFEGIEMDIVGPIPQTPRNNRYMLVAIDYYTRWPLAYAIENQEAH